jgi:hypothetical protein
VKFVEMFLGALELLLCEQPQIPAASVPAIEVVLEFRMLERATRPGSRNVVQAFAGANPERYLLVPGS